MFMQNTRNFLTSPSLFEHRSRLSCSRLPAGSPVSSSLIPTRLSVTVNRLPPPVIEQPVEHGRSFRNFLVESFHQKREFKDLFDELSSSGSCPLRILSRDGDWLFEKLRAVIAFLADAGRATEALQVFYEWKNKEKSRASAVNYSHVMLLFCERNLIDKAVLLFQDMERLNVVQSVKTYNVLIHGYARTNEFQESRALLTKMVENGLSPVPETYNGLIQAYGNYGLYDDMSKCVKMMESGGCYPNEVTYNILIREFARGGLVERMEKFYRTLLSKRMKLQSHTLITMLETYADFRILEKMEKMYFKVLNRKAYIKDELIRKMATVYIENCRFARLEEFGNSIEGRTGRSELAWCILLLSSAGLLSKKGMDSLSREMEASEVRWSTTFTNIFALFFLRMKDFKALNDVFSKALQHRADPDMLTVGILFDACSTGFKCTHLLEKWKRNSYLEASAEMKTDPLVISTFGKGPFMLKCEELYSSLTSEAKEKKLWKYIDLIKLVLNG